MLDQISIHNWIAKNNIRTEAGEVLDFHKYRFMYDVYADRSFLITCMKCAQIGFTTYEILKTAHECKNDGIDIVYVLPTDADVKTFSGGKTNKIISWNPILQTWTNDKDSVEQKQFGKNTVYYRGSWTNRAALSFTAKKLVVDEYDRCKQDIVEQYDSRLQSIANPKKAYFSNPSKPDFGVDLYWQKSDQKRWNIMHSCGMEYPMTENCVDYKRVEYICPHCDGLITDEERRMGRWVNKDGVPWTGEIVGNYEWSGYQIPLWIAPWMPAKRIAEAKRDKTPEYFSNFVAGEPYLNSNDTVTQQILESNLTRAINPRDVRMIIGVDTGHNIHYTLANEYGIFYHGYCKSVEENSLSPYPVKDYDPYTELDHLMSEYKDAVMVADQGGDLIGIRKMQEKYKGRVFLCWFTPETKDLQIIRWGKDAESGRVLVDRNRAIQMVVDELKDQRFPIFGNVDEWQPYFNHWKNIYRVREVKGDDPDAPQYNWRWVWKRRAADHWALSTVYARVGLDRFAAGLAEIIKPNEFMQGVEEGRTFNIPEYDDELATHVPLMQEGFIRGEEIDF